MSSFLSSPWPVSHGGPTSASPPTSRPPTPPMAKFRLRSTPFACSHAGLCRSSSRSMMRETLLLVLHEAGSLMQPRSQLPTKDQWTDDQCGSVPLKTGVLVWARSPLVRASSDDPIRTAVVARSRGPRFLLSLRLPRRVRRVAPCRLSVHLSQLRAAPLRRCLRLHHRLRPLRRRLRWLRASTSGLGG